MKAEIICIGTELLLGHIINSNASFIAGKLAGLGIDSYFQTTVGDNPGRLSDTLRTALDRSDIVITTGGLGPTVDDITTEIIAKSTSRKVILEQDVLKDIADFFRRMNKKIPKDSLKQVLIPEGAKWLRNPYGTAPGLIVECDEKVIIALPGPPREMQPMVENRVIPYLKKKVKAQGPGAIIKSRSLRLIGLAEAKVNEHVKDLLKLGGNVTVGIYAKQAEVELKIMAKAKDGAAADAGIKKVENVIRRRLKPYIYGADNETLADNVIAALIKREKTIAVAESCTGGLLSNYLTNVSGSSQVFMEGVVAYSNESKVKILGVRAQTLKKYGAVSPQIAREMAAGIRQNADTHIGIGVTGIAGPTGGTRTKPVGLVYIALALSSPRKPALCRQFNFLGSRTEIKYQAALAALDMVRCELL
jgi:nicotinamide-nucleotide amidase